MSFTQAVTKVTELGKLTQNELFNNNIAYLFQQNKPMLFSKRNKFQVCMLKKRN